MPPIAGSNPKRTEGRVSDEEAQASLDQILREGSDEPPAHSSRARVTISIIVVVIVAVVVAGAFLEFGGTRTNGVRVAGFQATAQAERREAPGFRLPDVEGKGWVSLDDFSGKVVLVNFWASWCLPCREEAPALQEAWEDYRRRGVSFVGIDERDDLAAARAFIDEFGITYPSGSDPAGSMADDYEILGLPSSFLIDRGGLIRYRFTGYLDAQTLRRTLDDLLAE